MRGLKADLDIIKFISESGSLCVRNKGNSKSTNAKIFSRVMEMVDAGSLVIVHKEVSTASGQTSVVVKLK
jgi:hypothetical protein